MTLHFTLRLWPWMVRPVWRVGRFLNWLGAGVVRVEIEVRA